MAEISYEKTCHIVIDIETLGIKNDAAILEIGLVVVEPNPDTKLLEKTWSWHGSIDLNGQHAKGVGNIEIDTLKWWISKGDILKSIYQRTADNDVYTFEYAFDCISSIVKQFRDKYNNKIYFWSRGTDFDFRILASHINAMCDNAELPWKYWEVRDIRTITNPLFLPNCPASYSNSHRALDDALNEAEDLICAINKVHN